MDDASWVHIAQTAIIALLLIGRWLQAREGGEKVTAEQLAELKTAVSEKADCDDVAEFARRLDEEHRRLRTAADKARDEVAQLQVDSRGQYERLNGVVKHVDDLHRRVFNGAPGGVGP